MRKWGVLVGLILLMLIATPSLAETVKVSKITANIQFSKDYGGISAGSSKTIILYLPCTLEDLNNTNNNITITADSATASTTIDLYANGVAVASGVSIAGGSSQTWTFVDFANAGVNMSTNYLNITIVAVANATTSDVLNLYGVGIPVAYNYSVKISESELSKPFVAKDSSYYSVRDTISVGQDSSLNLTDVVVDLSYPSFAISKPITSYTFSTLNTSETKSFTVSYEKQGPFVPEVRTYSSENNYTVTMKVYSYENLTATFDLNPNEYPWKEYFPEFSYSNIEKITLNGKEISWSNGSILMTLDLQKGYNTLNITYSKPAPIVIFATPTPWYNKTYILPVWAWIVVALAVIGIALYFRKR